MNSDLEYFMKEGLAEIIKVEKTDQFNDAYASVNANCQVSQRC